MRFSALRGGINKLSIHINLNFHKQFLNTDHFSLSWLEHGLKIPLKYYPPRYEEPNIKSVYCIRKLKEIIGEWVNLGTVMEVFYSTKINKSFNNGGRN